MHDKPLRPLILTTLCLVYLVVLVRELHSLWQLIRSNAPWGTWQIDPADTGLLVVSFLLLTVITVSIVGVWQMRAWGLYLAIVLLVLIVIMTHYTTDIASATRYDIFFDDIRESQSNF